MRPRACPPANAPVASTSRCCSSVAASAAATRPHAPTHKSAASAGVAPPRRRTQALLMRRRRSPPFPTSPSQFPAAENRTSKTALHASWVDYIPRIVDNIPRRIPPGAQDALQRAADGSGAASASGNTAVDVGGAVDALRRLVFPESLAAPSDLTLPVVIFGALAVGLALELATLLLKAVDGGEDGSGGDGGEGAAATPPPPVVDAPIVPPTSSSPPPRPAKAPTTPSRAQIEAERERLRDRIVAERYRGLTWLAAVTAAALFTAGLMNGATALRP